jgi:predicted nucleic acid-binding protein
MIKNVFFDTSAIYAYINAKDPDHRKVKSFINDFRGQLIITNYIFDEIVTLVTNRIGHETAVMVGNTLLNSPQIDRIWITQDYEKEAWKLFCGRNDKEYSFTDCITFIVMRQRNIKKCLAFDEHFKQEGFICL